MSKLCRKEEFCNHCFKCGSDLHFARGCRQLLKARRLPLRDEKQYHQCNQCCKGGGGQEQLTRCKQCKSVRYCSVECQRAQWQEHKLLCQAISHLSKPESKESKDPACVSHSTPREHAKVIGPAGKKCMAKCPPNDGEAEPLWDTGAQASTIPVKSPEQHPGNIAIRQPSEPPDTSPNLTTVNETQIPHIGRAEPRPKSSSPSSNSGQEEMIAPPSATSEGQARPIPGHNAIEEPVPNAQNPNPHSPPEPSRKGQGKAR